MVSRKIKKPNRNKNKYRKSVKLGRKQEGGVGVPVVLNENGETIVYQGTFIKTPVSGGMFANKQPRLIKLFEDRVEWWEEKRGTTTQKGSLSFQVRNPKIDFDEAGGKLTFTNNRKDGSGEKLILENPEAREKLVKLNQIIHQMKDITSPLFRSLISDKETDLSEDIVLQRTNEFLQALDKPRALGRYDYGITAQLMDPDQVFDMMNNILTIIDKIFYCQPTQGSANILIKKRELIIKILNANVNAIQHFLIPMNKITMVIEGKEIGLPMIDYRSDRNFMEHVKRILGELDDYIMEVEPSFYKPLHQQLKGEYKQYLFKITNLDEATKEKVPWSELDHNLKESYIDLLRSPPGTEKKKELSWKRYLALHHNTSYKDLDPDVKEEYKVIFGSNEPTLVAAAAATKKAWDSDLAKFAVKRRQEAAHEKAKADALEKEKAAALEKENADALEAEEAAAPAAKVAMVAVPSSELSSATGGYKEWRKKSKKSHKKHQTKKPYKKRRSRSRRKYRKTRR